jgi:hypothetical protein
VESAASIFIFYTEDGTADSSETLVNICQTTQHHILEDNNHYIKIRSTNGSLEGLLNSGTVYSDDYETNNFDQYSTRDDTRMLNGGSTSETQIKQQLPPSTPTSPLANNRTMPRPCDKRVDLYVLQPDRLNTSGQFNPLKGKLTNCHITGCERWVPP